MEERCDIAIVGEGPVGLLLACLLAQHGLDVRLLEREPTRAAPAPAIGLHPPGLACLAAVGAVERVLASGVRMRRGFVFSDARLLGKVSFAALPVPYPFVLTIPQREIERALEERLAELAPSALRRGYEVRSCEQGVHVATVRAHDGRDEHTLHARFVVGCDGVHSRVRQAARIAYPGGTYRTRFAMADVLDETPFGSDAVLFLARQGVVESFPLPAAMRRWVVALTDDEPASPEQVEQLVAERTGQRARACTATLMRSFVPEHRLAEHMVKGSFVLAGDAAHVISPIGGQSTSLGWLDAKLLAEVLSGAFAHPERAALLLAHYERTRRRAARTAMRRAELFMAVGQTQHMQGLRDLCLERLLSSALAERAAQVLTMKGLSSQHIV